jgi:hypothetical protein
MNRTSEPPSGLSRQQRRRLERELHKLSERHRCSFCGNSFPHASATAGGFDAHDNVVLAGDCCVSKVAKIFAMGLALTIDPIAAAQQKATVDKILDDAQRHGGLGRPLEVVLTDPPWKDADRKWFEQNPTRAHRVRPPFVGEADGAAANTPAGTALLMIVRQVKPGLRFRAGVSIDSELLPIPDDESLLHGLLEAAAGREDMPSDRSALYALSKKYAMRGTACDA